MNGGGSTLYEEPPPPPTIPLSHIKSSPSPSTTPVVAASSTVASGTSSTSPSSVTSNSGPLHIPAKRLVTSYGSAAADCVDGGSAGSGGASQSAGAGVGSVIRHPHHGSQPWSYSPGEHASPATAFDQYNSAAAAAAASTYSNLVAEPIGSRDGRKPAGSLFWSPATSAANSGHEYKYSPAGAAAAGCGEQAFAQGWCGYSAYSPHSRHYPESHHAHHPQPVPYLSSEERIRTATESAVPFAHESYPLRNYPPPPSDPLTSSPYAPPGTSNHICVPSRHLLGDQQMKRYYKNQISAFKTTLVVAKTADLQNLDWLLLVSIETRFF